MITSNENNSAEAFTQHQHPNTIGASSIRTPIPTSVSSSTKSTIQTIATTTTAAAHPDRLTTDVFAPSPLLDADVSVSVSSIAIPQEKKKQLWHQENGIESKLIFAICSYHILHMVIDIIQL